MVRVYIVLLLIIAALIVLLYSLLVIASRADERADRMYRKWKEEKHERNDI